MSPAPQQSAAERGASRPTKRNTNACIKCRERKVRCSGEHPCESCVRRSEECIFDHLEKKVTITERYLNDLKRKAGVEDGQPQASAKRQRVAPGIDYNADTRPFPETNDSIPSNLGVLPDPSPSSNEAETVNISEEEQRSLDALKNPLAAQPSTIVTDTHGRRRFLGPSSTWAYSRHVMSMIKGYLDDQSSPEVPLNLDGNAFQMKWPSMEAPQQISADGLPSLDYAIYLTNTVKFHIGQTYHLFDEQPFMVGLHRFFLDGFDVSTPCDRLWYIHFLVIMAFGKAFLAKNRRNNTPPGSDYFLRAIELLPDVYGLYADPILSVELCCSIALYLQSVDHRNSAYVYLGNALRVALTQGIHRELSTDGADYQYIARCRSVWWTVYILDRKFSSLMGAPCSISDENVMVSLPAQTNHSPQKLPALEIHVKLSRLIAKVLNIVYGADGALNISFVKSVHSVLRSLASLATELEGPFEVKLDCLEPISRVSATLNLCYHQCIVLTTRPLLMCLLKTKLDAATNRGHTRHSELAEPIKVLLKASSESANKSLKILLALQFQDLLETFLPFDLENAFSSALVLALIDVIYPSANSNQKYLQITYELLDTMIAGGNIPAQYRKQELERLQELLFLADGVNHDQPERMHTDQAKHQTMPIEQQSARAYDYMHSPTSTGLIGPHVATMNGLSPDNIMSVANMLDWETVNNTFTEDTSWLWNVDTSVDLAEYDS